MKYITLLLIALLSLASSCQKEDLPTDEHKNIFRCKVNGVEWTPHCISDPLFGCDAVDCQYYKEDKSIEISSISEYSDNSIDQFIRIYKYGVMIGENEIQKSSGYEFSNQNMPFPCGYYNMDTTKVHRLTILNIDTTNFTIEGSFEFDAIDWDNLCSDTVKITDGYFKLTYRF